MAKEKAKAKATETTSTVTIKDLSIEYGVEAADLRALLRANGMKAPEVTREPGTFGPKSKYEWANGSPELEKVRKLIVSTLENAEEAADEKPKAKTGKAKAAAPAEDEADDESDDVEPAPKAKAGKGKTKK